MDAFAITLREGIEAALVLGIIFAIIARDGRRELRGWVIGGAATAGVFSVAAAALLGSMGLSTESPLVEAVLYAVAAIAVLTMVVWVYGNAKNAGEAVKSKVSRIVGTGGSSSKAGIGLFALAFFMVAREGVETALFLSAAALSGNQAIGLVAGGVAGLSLAVLYGVLLARGSARIDIKLFFGFTSVVLALLGLKLLGSSFHEFEEAGIIPMSAQMAHFFDAVAKSTVVDWLFVVALVVPFAAPMIGRWRTAKPHPA